MTTNINRFDSATESQEIGIQSAGVGIIPKPRNPEKAARDQARRMAIFQRMIRERLDEVSGAEEQVAMQQTAPFRHRRQPD